MLMVPILCPYRRSPHPLGLSPEAEVAAQSRGHAQRRRNRQGEGRHHRPRPCQLTIMGNWDEHWGNEAVADEARRDSEWEGGA
jgi:hypothetical protein